jgi:hypothetical protein
MINTSSGASRGNKQKRIEKELLALRNLPREFKIGKKETGLGILLYVSLPLLLICDYSLRWKGQPYREPKAWTNRFIASTLKYF